MLGISLESFEFFEDKCKLDSHLMEHVLCGCMIFPKKYLKINCLNIFRNNIICSIPIDDILISGSFPIAHITFSCAIEKV
jgi:hypothetical protein